MVQQRDGLTIVTASFNSAMKLRTTYESILSQGVEFEYLIMDGGSTDGSLALANELSQRDSRVRVFSERDKGIYDAFNKAIPRASGKYIYFIGAGDVLLPGSLKQVMEHLPERSNCLVYGDVLREGNRYCGRIQKIFLAGRNLCQQSIFYGREVFAICGDFSLKYPAESDWEFNLRCFGNRRIRKIYMPVVVATFEPGGVSQILDTTFRVDLPEAVRRHLGMLTIFYMRLRDIFLEPFRRLISRRSGCV